MCCVIMVVPGGGGRQSDVEHSALGHKHIRHQSTITTTDRSTSSQQSAKVRSQILVWPSQI